MKHPLFVKLLVLAVFFTLAQAIYLGEVDSTVPLGVPNRHRVLSSAALKPRNYDYPELSCPQALQPVPLPANWSDTLAPLFARIAQTLNQRYVQTNKTVGMSVAVLYNQQTLWQQGIGYRDIEKTKPVFKYDIFRIGSISKVFVDLVLLQLRDAGHLSLDDQIVHHFPEWKDTIENVFPTKRGVTFRQLGSHMSGLFRSSPCDALWGDCNVSTAEILKRTKSLQSIQPIETRPSYSNFGFALLGRLMEKYYGSSFESIVEKNILMPLGMSDSGFTYTSGVKSQMAVGYFDGTSTPVPQYDLGWEAPAGQMYSNVYDLCQLMKLIFRDNYTEGAIHSQILDGQTIREWMLPLYVTAHSRTGVSSMGMPWENILPIQSGVPNYWVKGKSGGVLGYTAEMLMIEELKLGVVVLMNGYLTSPATEAAFDLLLDVVPAIQDILRQNQPVPALPPRPERLLGHYVLRDSKKKTRPMFQNLTAEITMGRDEKNHVRMGLQIFNSEELVLGSKLDYYEAFNKDADKTHQVVLQVALESDPEGCFESMSGLNQLVYFVMTSNGGKAISLELRGLFWDMILYRT